MKKSLSLYLDGARLAAAFFVLLVHAKVFVFPSIPVQIARNGPPAVAVFFALSGFVIRFVTSEKKERDWRAYATARVARIGSVVFLVLMVVPVVDWIGLCFNSGFYQNQTWFQHNADGLSLLKAITFSNEFWFSHSVYGSDEPYWSLGFEIPYYIVFGIFFFVPGRLKWFLILGWAMLVGPKVVLYMSLWALGAVSYDIVKAIKIRSKALGAAVMIAALALYLSDVSIFPKLTPPGVGFAMFKPWSVTDLLVTAGFNFIVALAFCLSIFGFVIFDASVDFDGKLSKAVRWLAGGSFTLYVLHMPLLVMTRAIFPNIINRSLQGAAGVLFVIFACYVAAEFGERRKEFFRKGVRRVMGG